MIRFVECTTIFIHGYLIQCFMRLCPTKFKFKCALCVHTRTSTATVRQQRQQQRRRRRATMTNISAYGTLTHYLPYWSASVSLSHLPANGLNSTLGSASLRSTWTMEFFGFLHLSFTFHHYQHHFLFSSHCNDYSVSWHILFTCNNMQYSFMSEFIIHLNLKKKNVLVSSTYLSWLIMIFAYWAYYDNAPKCAKRILGV